MRYTVLLSDHTVGVAANPSVKEGDIITISLQDENGNKITKTGKVIEILESKDDI